MKKLCYFINESLQKHYVNILVLSPNDKLLILRRANYMRKFGGKWGFPGGSIDKNDKNEIEAVVRELKEETGIELSWKEEHSIKKFDSIKNNDESISEYFIVNLENEYDVKISREHAKYEWYDPKEDKDYKWMPDIYHIIQKYYNN